MSADNNYNEILEKVCNKLNQIDSVKDLDLLSIKNSIESIESLITDTQAKLSFQEIKEKLENIALQVDNCNESLLKDLYNDINAIKEKSENFTQHLENIQNIQNLSLTSAEFEEFQKQQLDLALKTNENIFKELNELKEKAGSGSNSINNLNLQHLDDQLNNLHKTLTGYIEQMTGKFENIPNLDEIGSLMSDMASINQKNIIQTNSLIKSLETNFSEFKNQEFSFQISKISEIYDSLNIIHAWIEKVGFLNKSIENVYARLGANIDFDDVSEKVDIIYENISALNNWTMKIDNIDGNMSDVQSKVASLSSCIQDTRYIADVIDTLKNSFDNHFSDEIDLEDLSDKIDIIYENLTALNEWSQKIDNVSYEISGINKELAGGKINKKIDKISDNITELDNKISEFNINSKIDDLSKTVTSLNDEISQNLVVSKIDVIYDNIEILNEWVSKIDDIAKRSIELDNKFNRTSNNFNIKVEEITQTLSNANKLIEDVPNIKDKLEELSNELHLITRTTKNETESYIYTLLDIEADFLKLHKFLDDKTEQTTQDINSLKERFEELNDDISSISKRTNKLILSADDANKEFRVQLESFKNTINEFDIQRQEFNPESKFNLIGNKLAGISKLLQNSLNANNNLNTAFIYLAEWIDATGGILNSMQNEIAEIKSQTTKDNSIPELINNFASLKQEISSFSKQIGEIEDNFVNYKNDDVSEIKSILTGIIVQLNTALTPNIDSINERIDKLSEEHNNKFTELELLMKEKITQQEKQISKLEKQIDNLSNKFDKFIDTMSENNKNDEIKDILNYITTQVTAANEAITNNQNNTIANKVLERINNIDSGINNTLSSQKDTNEFINEVAQKLNSFDGNINKLVSYIEED